MFVNTPNVNIATPYWEPGDKLVTARHRSTLARSSGNFSIIAAKILNPHSGNERQQNYLQLNTLTDEFDGNLTRPREGDYRYSTLFNSAVAWPAWSEAPLNTKQHD